MFTAHKTDLKKRIKATVKRAYSVYQRRFLFPFLKLQRRFFIRKNGVNLVGYFSSNFGVAEVARFFAKQAIQVNLPFHIANIKSDAHHSLSNQDLKIYQPYINPRSLYYKTIFFINADMIHRHYGWDRELFIGRYNAAVFFWEFDDYFYFSDAFKVLNEAIAFTDFIATAIRKSAPNGFKVTKLNFPFIKNWQITVSPEAIRSRYAIPLSAFAFFFNFDFHSIYERKNPIAILKAMDIAFNQQDDVVLVLKTLHAEQVEQSFIKFQTVLNEIQLKNKIIVINENLERNEMMSIINASDSYISLHRSEGLGLGMMEAMSMGKPVIGTAFGGNLDFMNEDNSLLVDYKPVPLSQDELPYKKGWMWAEPNIQVAATYMRKLYDDRKFSEELGYKGQAYIESKYNSTVFSSQLQEWLHQK